MRKRRENDPSLVNFKERSKLPERYSHELDKCEERQVIMDVVAKIMAKGQNVVGKIHDDRGESIGVLDRVPFVGSVIKSYKEAKSH